MGQGVDAQEVEMFGIKKDRNKYEAQKERLLFRDFPWLWAVRSSWDLGSHSIRVRNTGDEMTRFLKERASSDFEVWVYFSRRDERIFEVERVRVPDDPRSSWASLIVDQFSERSTNWFFGVQSNARVFSRHILAVVPLLVKIDSREFRDLIYFGDVIVYRQKSPREINSLVHRVWLEG